MTGAERESVMETIRRGLQGDPDTMFSSSVVSFLLAELDAATAAIHDLQEESAAYRRGLAEGVALNLRCVAAEVAREAARAVLNEPVRTTIAVVRGAAPLQNSLGFSVDANSITVAEDFDVWGNGR